MCVELPTPDTSREAPSLLGQCRWALECTLDATVEVTLRGLGFTTVACVRHAEEHQTWKDTAPTRINPGPEPEPEEWCPDPEDLLGDDPPPPYCPRHGTPAERGIEEAW